jgi:L-asparaginase / beta-aspartyl-peptidase
VLVLLASANGIVGLDAGRAILEAGGSALDAVETVARIVEDNADDHTVGLGGYPNLLGQVELDAAIMDGATRRAGAVAALQGFRNPIVVARQVLERLPHVLLAGDGAALFAKECGLSPEPLLTEAAEAVYRKGIGRLAGLEPPLAPKVRQLVVDPDHVTGTVNVLARDRHGHLAAATSTSGWAWKHPGRVGDTPIIGAGNYCDDRFGAAACTGWGELAIRAVVAHTIVQALRHGASAAEAALVGLADLPDAGIPEADTPVSVLCLDPSGGHAAASTAPGRRYAYWDDTLDAPELRLRSDHRDVDDDVLKENRTRRP